MPEDGKKIAIGVGIASAIGALIYFATKAMAAPPVGIYCPYDGAGPFATLEEVNAHITAEHPGKRLLTHIIWQ